MTDIVNIFGIVVVSYIVGSVPTAFLLGKMLKGINIREHGSGNVGATNAFRVLGKGPGTVVLLIDIIKGIVPVVVVAGMLHPDIWGRILAAVAAVCGHNWTCFLRFKGGKGIATTLGVLIGLMIVIPTVQPVVFFCVLAWCVSFIVTSYISVSSIIAAIFLPILMLVFSAPSPLVILSIIFCVSVVFRHQPNIHRLMSGQEPKVPLPFHRAGK